MKKQNSTTLRKRIGRLLLLGLIVSGCGIAPAHAQKDAARTIEILAVNDMHAAIDKFPASDLWLTVFGQFILICC